MLDGPPRVAALPGRCDAAPAAFRAGLRVVLLGVGEPGEFDGGGLWYPPAVDAKGDVYPRRRQPGPVRPNSPKNPTALLARPEPLHRLARRPRRQHRQAQVVPPGDRPRRPRLRPDDPPVLFTPSGGSQLVIGAGKMGKVFAWNAATGASVWRANVGKHRNDTGPPPKKPVTVCPGTSAESRHRWRRPTGRSSFPG